MYTYLFVLFVCGISLNSGQLIIVVQEIRAQIWPNLALDYLCHFMIDSPDSSLFKSAG